MNAHLYAHIVITLFAIGCFYYNVMRIRTDVYEMRTEYLAMLKKEVEQVHDCFDKWQATIDVLDASIKLNNEILDAWEGDQEE